MASKSLTQYEVVSPSIVMGDSTMGEVTIGSTVFMGETVKLEPAHPIVAHLVEAGELRAVTAEPRSAGPAKAQGTGE